MLGVVDDHGPAVLDRLADKATPRRHPRADQLLPDRPDRDAEDVAAALIVDQVQAPGLGAEHVDGAGDHAFEQAVEIERRRDGQADVIERRELTRAGLGLAQQPRAGQRARGLIGHCVEDLELVFGVRLGAGRSQQAKDILPRDQGHGDPAGIAARIGRQAASLELVGIVVEQQRRAATRHLPLEHVRGRNGSAFERCIPFIVVEVKGVVERRAPRILQGDREMRCRQDLARLRVEQFEQIVVRQRETERLRHLADDV